MNKKKDTPLEIGEKIIERIPHRKKKRIGEVIFVQEGKTRKLELVQLNSHALSP